MMDPVTERLRICFENLSWTIEFRLRYNLTDNAIDETARHEHQIAPGLMIVKTSSGIEGTIKRVNHLYVSIHPCFKHGHQALEVGNDMKS